MCTTAIGVLYLVSPIIRFSPRVEKPFQHNQAGVGSPERRRSSYTSKKWSAREERKGAGLKLSPKGLEEGGAIQLETSICYQLETSYQTSQITPIDSYDHQEN